MTLYGTPCGPCRRGAGTVFTNSPRHHFTICLYLTDFSSCGSLNIVPHLNHTYCMVLRCSGVCSGGRNPKGLHLAWPTAPTSTAHEWWSPTVLTDRRTEPLPTRYALFVYHLPAVSILLYMIMVSDTATHVPPGKKIQTRWIWHLHNK